jgi:predicted nucleic acid-binding Zn ribbon protein
MEKNIKTCLFCNKPIRGRTDKKFCDDYCRNNYNNRQNSDQNNLVRNINNALRKNRRLLAEALGENEMRKVRKTALLEKGYNSLYHTHIYQTQKHQTYFFCYEYGFLPLEEELWLLVKRKQAEG